ncbi:MAG TPA: trypsin-like peptidase domain-containing protein [Vicinamibacterales bacterium]|nr:trypsin-like peptidase domain-containing protein [Vicinamibacterales bacterium]
MSSNHLYELSDGLADAVDTIAASVVQVQVRRQPVSGVAFGPDAVLTTGRALARDRGVRVKTPDGRVIDAEVKGWDPATHLAVLSVPGLSATPAVVASRQARVGHVAIAVGRSWSNAVTATVGNVAIIGGPLPTGPGRSIERIIRTTAPMHGGFAGGALADAAGQVIGIATAAEIRGLGVVIPGDIAWKAAGEVLEHGQVSRGFLGLAGQTVRLSTRQRGEGGPETALLVVGVVPDSPAEAAGFLVGDVLLAFDGVTIDSPERLLETLARSRAGATAMARVLRGSTPSEFSVVVGERPAR